MTPERWQRVDEVFEAAMECDPDARAAFLDEACAGDQILRNEVESLLVHDEQSHSFIEEPAFRGTLKLFPDDQPKSLVGQQIGFYKIINEIGRGGMGIVYLGRDTRLRRQVALKLLPENFTKDKDRVYRFRQEARAASALNHPNILTIYEIGRTDRGHFIATEFIDGKTLREQISGVPSGLRHGGESSGFPCSGSLIGTRIHLSEVLDIAIQIASALVAAHAEGIVHRDIKPENIMVRHDALVKVLDFGLAKLTQHERLTNRPEAPTVPVFKTDPGMVLGTAQYMSPEQARGIPVDARTDIWSLGVVLYEMVAGCVPFDGTNKGDVIASILKTELPLLSQQAPNVPAELQRIVRKALCKDRAERYQTVKDMELDLKTLRRALEADSTSKVEAFHSISNVEYLVSEIKRHKAGAVVVMAAIVMAFGAAIIGLPRLVSQSKHSPPTNPVIMELKKLTDTGTASDAAISPDGKYVAYVVSNAGQESLYVKQLAATSNVPIQIIPPGEGTYKGLTFAPDSNHIYYVTSRPSEPDAVLYQMPVLKPIKTRLLANVNSAITFSPDGKRFAFVRNSPARGESALMTANVDGTEEQTLARRKLTQPFHAHPSVPAWSPDGEVIACAATVSNGDSVYTNVFTIDVQSGAAKPVSPRRWNYILKIAWLGDSRSLVINAREQPSDWVQIWQLPYPSGEARRITHDPSNYVSVSLTADYSQLVTVQADRTSTLWVVPEGNTSLAKRATSSKHDGYHGLSWTPDERIVYDSWANGNWGVWITEANGTNQEPLISDMSNISYTTVSPNGLYVVFVSLREGKRNIWRMDIDGGNLKQLTSGAWDIPLQCSPDGKWVVYSSYEAERRALRRVSIDGGSSVLLANNHLSLSAAISPDGEWIAYHRQDEPNSPHKLAIIPFEGGHPEKTFDVPKAVALTDAIRWQADSRALTYIATDGGISNIWSQPFDGSPPKQITDFKADLIFNFDWSRDGKHLAVARGTRTSDIILFNLKYQ